MDGLTDGGAPRSFMRTAVTRVPGDSVHAGAAQAALGELGRRGTPTDANKGNYREQVVDDDCSCARDDVGGGTNYAHNYGRGGSGRPGYLVRGYEAIGPHYRGARPGIVAGTPAGLAAIGVAP